MNTITTMIVRFFERWMPDAFAVALGLTLLTFALALTITETTPTQAIGAWSDGFWSLLSFTNQIALTLVLGYGLASTRAAHALLLRTAGFVRSARSAYAVVCLVTGVLALLSWSLALVAAGLTSRAVAEACRNRGIRVHYPLLVASAFSGFVIWHQGLSGSIPLTIATPGHFLESQIGIVPTSQTLFAWWNLLIVGAVLATLPFVMALLHPRDEAQITEIPDDLMTPAAHLEPTQSGADNPTPAERIERSRLLVAVVVALGAASLYLHFGVRDAGLTLNSVNFTLLIAGLLCAGSVQRYTQCLAGGGHIAVPFLIQYPFYAGIAGLIASSGLGRMMVELFAAFANADNLPLVGFLSAGLLNIFIPSGGAQWAVQGPIMMTAAERVGADIPMTAMSVALGDQWTNLIQPLILLPVLTVARISVRAVVGYSMAAMLWCGLIFTVALVVAQAVH